MNIVNVKIGKKILNIEIVEIIVCAYCILSVFMFAFINTIDATALHISYVPYINGLVIYFHVFLTIACIGFLTVFAFSNNIRLDSIAILLLLKCFFDIITYMVNINAQLDNYFGYYACSVTAFTAYFIGLQLKNRFSFIKILYCLFAVIVAFQTISTTIAAGVSFLDINYKSQMNIPYGASNIIASLLVPCFFAYFFIKSKFRYLYAVLIIAALILTKSRGGILLFCCALIAFLMFKNMKKRMGCIFNIAFLIVIIILTIFVFSIEGVRVFFEGYAVTGGDITSGRLNLFLQDFLESLNKPILGHGLGAFSVNATGSHNLFIDLLLKCGLVGFMLYCGALFLLFKKVIKNGAINNFFFVFIVIMLINSLFEVCYFSYKCDTVFWYAAGVLSSFADKSNKNSNRSPLYAK